MAKISVIIPVYKVERYLERCLESVMKQTFQEWEVICVNDGSPDNSVDILKKYSQLDSRIRFISQKNQGLSMARNNGLLLAAGEYIYFLDSDDEIHPQALEIAFSFAQRYEAELVCWGYGGDNSDSFYNEKINISELEFRLTEKPLFLTTHKGDLTISFNVWTKLYKRELLEGISFIPNIHFEDYPHTFAIMAKKPRTAIINKKLHYYRINPDSISNKSENVKQIEDYFVGLRYVCDVYNNNELLNERNFIKMNLIPNILQQQLSRCRHAEKEQGKLMWKLFETEFIFLRNAKMIDCCNRRCIKCWLYIKINTLLI